MIGRVQLHIVLVCIISLVLVMEITEDAFSQEYELTIIEPSPGYEMSSAYGINSHGHVVGGMVDSDDNYYAFVWDNSTITILESLGSVGSVFDSGTWKINDEGKVSGYSANAEENPHAVVWDISAGTVLDIHSGNVAGDFSATIGINANGQVVGAAEIPVPVLGSVFHAFLYDDANGFLDLGTMNTSGNFGGGYSAAISVNSSGEVVGAAQENNWKFRPFIYTASNGMKPLPIDSTHLTGEWGASIISDNGLIGGIVILSDIQSLAYPWVGSESLPYIWNDSDSLPVAITMPTGFPYGVLCGINNSGSMVGSMWDSNAEDPVCHAFVYDAVNGLRDLNDLITIDPDVILEFASGINERGQIVGYGTQNGIKRAFLLNLSNPGLQGDVNLDDVVNILDITACINHITGTGDLSGQAFQNSDMNSDNMIDILDMIAIVNIILEVP